MVSPFGFFAFIRGIIEQIANRRIYFEYLKGLESLSIEKK